MSLSTIKLFQVVKKQYNFKLKANIGLFNSLIILQLFGILFSLGGTGQMGGSFYNLSFYTADFMIVFTMIWAFAIAFQLTTKDYRNAEFIFVTNRRGSDLSNTLFLLTASIIGAFTALLSGYLSKVIVYFSFKKEIINAAQPLTIKPLIYGFSATVLFIFVFSLLGYFFGAIVQLNRVFMILLPVLFIGFLLIAARAGEDNLLIILFEFYFQEFSFPVFLVKMIVTSLLLFKGSTLITNRLEVK